jgi:hypothetical protein
MSLMERRNHLLQQIKNVNDEQTLEMLEETLAYYTHNENKDITEGLDNYQLKELATLMNEPAEKDTLPEEEFRKLFDRWNTK